MAGMKKQTGHRDWMAGLYGITGIGNRTKKSGDSERVGTGLGSREGKGTAFSRVDIVDLLVFFLLFGMLRGTQIPGFAHSALMRVEDFLV
jgi:hypothetical protein